MRNLELNNDIFTNKEDDCLIHLFPKLAIRGYDIICGDALSVLRSLPGDVIHSVITSPPYFGLRSYLPENHEGKVLEIGFGETVDHYIRRLVEVFTEAKRVLRPDGTIWLNIGDSYAPKATGNLKRKDLIGIPWTLALALRDSGLYLRSEIIWNKPNPMPESVTDRPTKAHEQIFLLAKSEDYYYDADAVREPNKVKPHAHGASKQASQITTIRSGAADAAFRQPDRIWGTEGGRNKRSVWTVNVAPYKGAHMATFPGKLIETCVLAGCPPQGVILDPFNGAGTSGLVSLENGRRYLGIELNEAYCTLSEDRLRYFDTSTTVSMSSPIAA
jgi:DNA modification methylase